MLNQDYSLPVTIDTAGQQWEASPAAKVWRKKLERQQAESGRATSVVRYEAGASFKTHQHPDGEEILVLRGTFSDESGDYGPGSYLRNPAGTEHAPWSEPGCELLVKLCYFQPGDMQSVRINTGRAGWHQGNTPGQKLLPLHQFNGEITQLVWLESGQVWRPVVPRGGLEMFVVEGQLTHDQQTLNAQTWLRRPGLTRCEFTVSEGPARVLLKTGHLPTESV